MIPKYKEYKMRRLSLNKDKRRTMMVELNEQAISYMKKLNFTDIILDAILFTS